MPSVTPLAGVWIEIGVREMLRLACCVTPLAGVWIEMSMRNCVSFVVFVTPLAGVWIEMISTAEDAKPELFTE